MQTDFFKRLVQVLHLEDNEKDHFLVSELLRANGLNCEFTVAKSQSEFVEALKSLEYDLIISDFTLPSYDGLSALSVAREVRPQTPFIFFSGTIGEDVAVESLKNGATDYVLKQRPHRLIAAIHRALKNSAERARLQRTENALQESEERFRIIARATNDVIWEWDIKNNRFWFSENFQTSFGHNTAEMTSEQWFDLVHPDDRGRMVSGISALLASGGKVWWSEHRMRRANDSYARVFDRASVIYDSSGKPIRMVGAIIDMTERKLAEEKIREQAELLDKAQDAIIVCTMDRSILYWNKGAERVYGWKTHEVLGKNIRRVLFHETLPEQLHDAVRDLETHDEWVGELLEFSKDDKPLVVQARATVIRDEHGQPKSLLIINTDITERKQLEEQFLRAQRLESLGVLVSGIAHDLNNALAPILIGINMLRSQSISREETNSILGTLEASAQRGTEMVKQVLAFARGGESSKSLIPVDKLVKEMGKIITDTFPKSIRCQVQVAKDSWPVFGIATQVHQVLMNLCVNARDAMPNGGTLTLATENVKLTAAETAPHAGVKPGNYLSINVRDTGAGIPAEKMDKIFDAFFTTKAPGKGTGLGLSTSQTIVKNHGGFITVQSQIGQGTEFKFYLPVAVASAPAEPAAKALLPVGNGEGILIVDDEETILAIMRTALENYGYHVVSANGGIEAVTRFADHRDEINLVITDLEMPFMNGYATIAALRKMNPDMKVIIATGSEQERNIPLEEQIKTAGFIQKPFTTEKLLTAVYKALTQKK